MKRTLKVIGWILLTVIVLALAGGLYVNFFLPDTGSPQNVKIELTPQRIERGRYLANHVAACMDCHSTRDWTLFSGPMKTNTLGQGGDVFNEDMGMPGTIYAPNITPHALGNWTDGEILRAVTTGVNKDGKALFPLMGYSRFGKMDQEDIYSIIAYIRSIQPIANNVPATKLNFPVSLIVKTLPQPASFSKRPDEKDVVKYGGYLINASGCVDCHSKTDKGNVIAGTEFGGGMEFKQPAGIMRAPNITMDEATGIGSWTKAAFVSRFKMYADSSYKPQPVGQDELQSPMPWMMFAGMETKDLEAIYAYLESLKPISNKVEVRSLNKK